MTHFPLLFTLNLKSIFGQNHDNLGQSHDYDPKLTISIPFIWMI
jgi:hypothetical protein